MAKKSSIYSKVNFKTLKNELFSTISYLSSEPVNDELQDDLDFKITKTGGISLTVVSSMEKKIETQMGVIDTCSKILKSIFEKEGLSETVKNAIETLTNKLEEIENYYASKPIGEMTKRYTTATSSKGKPMTFMVISREDRITSRTRVLEKIHKVKPLITELESLKEEIILKGGYEVPESMIYD